MNTITEPSWAAPAQDLRTSTILVVGGVGGVGEGVVRALLARGASVIATSRSASRAEEFAARVGDENLRTAVLDALSPDFRESVQALQAEYGGFDGVVVTIASWGDQGRKPLLALTDAEWDTLVAENQTAVFRAYRALYPLISRDGVLVQLNGLSADIAFPGGGGVALTAAATKSMTRTIAAEMAGRGARVYEVILGVVRTRARRLAGIDDLRWIDGEEIGVHVAELLAGTSPLTDTPVQYFVDKSAGPQAEAPTL
ncbi:SDR family oxidoreductase [Leifsonia sp. SIMBA_070]|uniref:SDR family oxidoreductase n=1 Tax=Leifsonia sp. SIMBA_070 TaxID=3085810 RepID=UPI00397D4931